MEVSFSQLLIPENWAFSSTAALHSESSWAILTYETHFIPKYVETFRLFTSPILPASFPGSELAMSLSIKDITLLRFWRQVPCSWMTGFLRKIESSFFQNQWGNLNLSPLCRCLAASDIFIRTCEKKSLLMCFSSETRIRICAVTEYQLCLHGKGFCVCVKKPVCSKVSFNYLLATMKHFNWWKAVELYILWSLSPSG